MTPQQTLQKYFGYSNFRDGQIKIINSILNKKDTLAILPTGGGKSICFQIPGLIMEGTTIVVSPLISLMKDQIDALNKKNIPATLINSSLSKREVINRLKNLTQRKYKFVYLAPERLKNIDFIRACQKIEIPLIAIDESHCISMWGHDFRPDYTQISEFFKQIQDKPVIAAFTATATQLVRADIIHYLKMDNHQNFLNSFSRKNLSFHLTQCNSNFSQELALFILMKKHFPQPGIIYTSTQKKTEYIARLIKHYWGDKFPIQAYHAGLKTKQRAEVQDQFLNNQLQIIVATNAFGMGVDKANVRWVIHYQIPGNLENYYQEAGRAGRDQSPSNCYLLFNPTDVEIQKTFINQTEHQNKKLKEYRLWQLSQMFKYTQTRECRLKYILNYFDEKSLNCERCDICTKKKLGFSTQDQEYFNFLTSKKRLFPTTVLTPKIIYLLVIHRPQSKTDFLKIPGIGGGWVEKWYNQVFKLLEIGARNVNDPQTAVNRISENC